MDGTVTEGADDDSGFGFELFDQEEVCCVEDFDREVERYVGFFRV